LHPQLVQNRLLSRLHEPIRQSPVLEASLPDVINSVKPQGLEGMVAKRADSRYEPGQRRSEEQVGSANSGTRVTRSINQHHVPYLQKKDL
jgi:hypothetical protein